MAEYGVGAWDEAIKALSNSMDLTSGGSAADWLFLAMAHYQKRDKNAAHSWYDRAVAWMDQNQSKDEELIRFLAEAAALIRPKDSHAKMPNGVAAFAAPRAPSSSHCSTRKAYSTTDLVEPARVFTST